LPNHPHPITPNDHQTNLPATPPRPKAADRAGISLKNFDHAIDAACEKLAQLGWPDLTGPARLTTLAQLVVNKRIVTADDLTRLSRPVP
jgi:hypothetical protein